jgi:hypothetical protein
MPDARGLQIKRLSWKAQSNEHKRQERRKRRERERAEGGDRQQRDKR